MTSRKKRITPTKKYKRRINTQREREEEEEVENTSLKNFVEEEEWEHEIDVSSTNVERDDRPVEEEQDDILISKRDNWCLEIMHSKGKIIF